MDLFVGKTVALQSAEDQQWLAADMYNYVYTSSIQVPSATSWIVEKDPSHYNGYSFRLPNGYYLAGNAATSQMYLKASQSYPETTWACSAGSFGNVYMQAYQQYGTITYTSSGIMFLAKRSNSNTVYFTEFTGSLNTQWLPVETHVQAPHQPTPNPPQPPQPTPNPPQPPQPTPNLPQPPQPVPQPAKAFKSYEIDAELRKIPSLKNVVMPR